MKRMFITTRRVLAVLAILLLLGGCRHRPAAPMPDTTVPEPVPEWTAEQTVRPAAETLPSTEASTEPSSPFSEETAPITEAPTETSPPSTEETAPATEGPPEEPFVYMGLVELTAVDDRFVIDQRYATENNFTGRIHYDRVLCLVQEDILPMLVRAADLAEAEGCRIKIWDAYRPVSVQQALHDSAPAELAPYVPAPGPWSMHARGITVDVTLCDLEGKELDMPTEFDDFSVRANSDNPDATEEQIANRELLNRIMSGAGFTRSSLEWWHFDGPNRDNYQILDLSFAEYEAARDAQ